MDSLEDFVRINDYYVKTLIGYKKIDLVFKQFANPYLIFMLENVQPDLIDLYKGKEIFTKRANLPAPNPNEFYICDLKKCVVYEFNGEELGKVEEVLELNGNFFIEVNGYVVPFREFYVSRVDIDDKKIILSENFSEEKDYYK